MGGRILGLLTAAPNINRPFLYGWWSSGRKGKQLPEIRAALGLSSEGEAQPGQPSEPDAALLERMDEALRVKHGVLQAAHAAG